MKNALRKILYCLPVMVVLMLTVFLTTPAAHAAQLKTPVLNKPVCTVSGVKVSWKKVTGAEKYRVYVKTGSASWKKLADTAATSYLHKAAKSGTKYTYTVRCISRDGYTDTSSYDRTGKSITYVKAPAIASISNTAGGAKLKWSASKGAAKYRVYVKSGSSWKSLATTTKNYYVHKAAKQNTTYTYRVRCLNKSGQAVSANGSSKSNKYRYASYTNESFAEAIYTAAGKAYQAPSSPKSKLTRSSAATILCKALGYGKRTLVTVADTTDYNLKTIASYGYLIPDKYNRVYPTRAITIDEYESILGEVNRWALYHGCRLLTFGDSIMAGKGNSRYGYGRLIAEKYGMSYKTYSKNGATFSTKPNERGHISDQVKSAHTDRAKADIIMLNGGTNDMLLVSRSAYTERFNAKQPAQSNFSKGFVYTMELIRKYWTGVPVIYVRDHNMAACSDTLERQMGSYGLSIAKKHGATTVDIYSGSKLNAEDAAMRNRYTMYRSDYKSCDSIHPTGLGYTAYYLPLIEKRMVFTPTLNTPSNISSGVSLSWKTTGSSPKYRVYYKSGSAWVKLTDTTTPSYVHESAVSGKKYTYTVRCLSADGKSFTSNFNSTGKSITYIKAPTLSLSNEYNGVKLSWNASKGAAKYRVMLHNGSAWVKLTDTAATSYTYTAAISGSSYNFAVRCISSDGKSFISAASPKRTITFIEAPQITSATDTTNGVDLTWTASANAARYRLMLIDGDSRETLTETDGTVYKHDADHDTSYTYTVVALDETGTVISGSYPGYTHRYCIPAMLDAPVITGSENTEDGLLIRWNPVIYAQRYRLLYKNGSRWNTLAETEEPAYLYRGAVSGESLTVTVCCVSLDGTAYTSAYDPTGKTFTYYKAPEITFTNTSTGLLLTLESSEDASPCRIYIKDGAGYRQLTDTAEMTYHFSPAVYNTEYTFTACYLDEEGDPVGPAHNDGYAARFIPDPANAIYTTASFADDVYASLGIAAVTPDSPNAALTRRNASEILCRALGYANHTKGVNLLDSDNSRMKTAVFFGYFLPDDSDRIYPESFVTESEYASMLTDVDRYKKLMGKTALAFGDSIMYGEGNNKYSSSRILCEKYGMTFINYAYSGATFSTENNGRTHISDRIKTAHSAGYKADIIFLNGGTNDLTFIRNGQSPNLFDPTTPEASAYIQGFELSMSLIREYWGDAPVLYIRNHNMVVSSEELEQQLGEYGLSIAERFGAHTLDIYSDTAFDTGIPEIRDRYTMFRSDLGRSDGIHPNLLGYLTYYLPAETEKLLEILLPPAEPS